MNFTDAELFALWEIYKACCKIPSPTGAGDRMWGDHSMSYTWDPAKKILTVGTAKVDATRPPLQFSSPKVAGNLCYDLQLVIDAFAAHGQTLPASADMGSVVDVHKLASWQAANPPNPGKALFQALKAKLGI